MQETLHKHMLTFLYSVLESPKEIVSYIGKLALLSAKSPMGITCPTFKYKFGIVYDNSLQMSMTSLRKVYMLNGTHMAHSTRSSFPIDNIAPSFNLMMPKCFRTAAFPFQNI